MRQKSFDVTFHICLLSKGFETFEKILNLHTERCISFFYGDLHCLLPGPQTYNIYDFPMKWWLLLSPSHPDISQLPWPISPVVISLHWRNNDHDGVSNHQPHGCLLNRLFRLRSKKTVVVVVFYWHIRVWVSRLTSHIQGKNKYIVIQTHLKRSGTKTVGSWRLATQSSIPLDL